MKILFVGDIVGKVGREKVKEVIPRIKEKEKIQFIIGNGECAGDKGRGMEEKDVQELVSAGIDCITSGESIWGVKWVEGYLKTKPNNLLRPANYPPMVPGLGSCVYKVDSHLVGVINLLGRSFLANIDCPFRVGKEEIKKMTSFTNLIIIDFHAQTTAEKQAFLWWVGGKVTAVIGTHTKVATADERVVKNFTAYVTDVGMIGAKESVVGMEEGLYLEYFLKGIPVKIMPPKKGEAIFMGVILEIDPTTGGTKKIKRITF